MPQTSSSKKQNNSTFCSFPRTSLTSICGTPSLPEPHRQTHTMTALPARRHKCRPTFLIHCFLQVTYFSHQLDDSLRRPLLKHNKQCQYKSFQETYMYAAKCKCIITSGENHHRLKGEGGHQPKALKCENRTNQLMPAANKSHLHCACTIANAHVAHKFHNRVMSFRASKYWKDQKSN